MNAEKKWEGRKARAAPPSPPPADPPLPHTPPPSVTHQLTVIHPSIHRTFQPFRSRSKRPTKRLTRVDGILLFVLTMVGEFINTICIL